MRGRARGAAMVEAVIVLPVLVLLLVAVRFVAGRKEAEQSALAEARRCALQHALGGCQRVPPGCDAVLRHGAAGALGARGSSVGRALTSASARLTPLSGVPALAAALSELAVGSSGATASSAAPASLSNGRAVTWLRAQTEFPCSERPHDDDVAAQVFRAVAGPFFGTR